jgi:tol-pal system protein YbgF
VRRALALLLLGASACWTPAEKGRQMEARLDKLEGESQASARQLDEQRSAVRERIGAIDAKIDELNAAARRSGADLAVNQDKMLDELTRLRGQLEELSHRLDQTEKALAQQKDETEGRFAALKGSGALAEYEARKKAQEIKRPADKNEFMALAQQQERTGDRAVARQLYDEFVKRWPTDPLSADAHFRLGELWFGDKRYREAILEYGKVAQDFPRSDKAPDALFRTGESMLALDLRPDARSLFEEVQRRYPGTTAARRAKQRLADLGGGGTGGKKADPKKKKR